MLDDVKYKRKKKQYITQFKESKHMDILTQFDNPFQQACK